MFCGRCSLALLLPSLYFLSVHLYLSRSFSHLECYHNLQKKRTRKSPGFLVQCALFHLQYVYFQEEFNNRFYGVYFIKIPPVHISSTVDWVGERVVGLYIKSAWTVTFWKRHVSERLTECPSQNCFLNPVKNNIPWNHCIQVPKDQFCFFLSCHFCCK